MSVECFSSNSLFVLYLIQVSQRNVPQLVKNHEQLRHFTRNLNVSVIYYGLAETKEQDEFGEWAVIKDVPGKIVEAAHQVLIFICPKISLQIRRIRKYRSIKWTQPRKPMTDEKNAGA